MHHSKDIPDIISTLEDLISFRSTSTRPDELFTCAAYIETFFSETSYKVTRFEHEGVLSLYVSKDGSKKSQVLLCGHFDVVDGDDHQFEPYQQDSRVYGRGSMDMKSGIAVFLHAMKEIENEGYNVAALFVGDEEQGGWNGTAHVLEQGYTADIVLMPDGGQTLDQVVGKEKGILWGEFVATGASAHGSRPWEGESAIGKLRSVMDSVEALFAPLTDHPEDRWVATVNFGMIQGGSSGNSIPDHAKVSYDIRITENENASELMKKIRTLISPGVEMISSVESDAIVVPKDHKLVQVYTECMQEIGRTPEWVQTHGSSDARHFLEKGIPSLLTYPDGNHFHANNEWVSIDAVYDYYRLVKIFIEKAGKAS